MPYKNIDKLREYRRKWYRNNKEFAKEKVVKRKKLISMWLTNYKSTLVCSKCGESDIACLDFHHKNPEDKDMVIAKVLHHGWSKEHIMKEIGKCEVLCSNCHRKFHYYSSVG